MKILKLFFQPLPQSGRGFFLLCSRFIIIRIKNESMKRTGTIILQRGTTLDIVARHLVAFANSRQEVTMELEFGAVLTCEEMENTTKELKILLLEFGEAELPDYVDCRWNDGNLIVHLHDWGGPLLFEDEHKLYIRRDCKVSALNRENQKGKLFTPIVVP